MILITNEVKSYHGITGNLYLICTDVDKLKEVCDDIDKNYIGIKWSQKHQTYVIRIKSKKHKYLIKRIFEV